jgi:predicted amidohydrolase YtcJ
METETYLLTCGIDELRETKVLRTYLGGKLIYRADQK